MSHYDDQIAKPEGWDSEELTAVFAAICPRVIPLKKKFEPGHGRTDLERLYDVVRSLDMGYPTILEIRNNLVAYLNTRPDKIPSER